MKRLLTATLMLSLLGCTSKPSKPNGFGNGTSSDATSGDADTDDTEMDEQAKAISLLPDEGSKMRFMDGRALTQLYSRVFSKSDYGFAHCASDKPKDFEACDNIFAPSERSAVGMFDLYSQRMGRGVQNVGKPENLTLNYMRSLRAALGRECDALVTKEEKALKDDATAKTIFVKAAGPTAASLKTYFEKLMGTSGQDIDFDVPYDQYYKAYLAAVEAESDKAKASHNAYVNLCLSISMEPQVFLY